MSYSKNAYQSNADPPRGASAVTPSDSTDLSGFYRGISVNVAGTVKMTLIDGDTISAYIAAGIMFPCCVKRVWSTGTDAGITAIVAWK